MAWKVTVHTVFIESDRGIVPDAYSQEVDLTENIPATINDLMGAAVSEGDTIVSITVVPVIGHH